MSMDPELAFEERDYSDWSNQRSSPFLVGILWTVGSTSKLEFTDTNIIAALTVIIAALPVIIAALPVYANDIYILSNKGREWKPYLTT
ncbi:hypothetical protein EON63_04275 [archaeon]|nr:MAG: hypothetical protein EON63_04275 [archaeon]